MRAEIHQYRWNSESFYEKWDNDRIRELHLSMIRRAKDKKAEVGQFFGRAKEFFHMNGEGWSKEEWIQQIDNEYRKINFSHLFDYLDADEREIMADVLSDYKDLIVNFPGRSFLDRYPYMYQLLTLLGGFGINAELNEYELEELPGRYLPRYCHEIFHDIRCRYSCRDYLPSRIADRYFLDGFILSHEYRFTKPSGEKFLLVSGSVENPDMDPEKGLLSLSGSFLQKTEKMLFDRDVTNTFSSFADFILRIAEQYNAQTVPQLKRFKDYYEATREEILILDQRYFSEKQLEESRHQAEMRLQEESRQAELDRQQALQFEKDRQREAERQYRAQEEYQRKQLEIAKKAEEDQKRRFEIEQRERKEQIAAQKSTSRSVLTARIAELESERGRLNGPNDTSRRLAVESELQKLKFERDHL